MSVELQNFWALDVETATADRSTICQIGAVEFIASKPARRLCKLVNPGVPFDSFNVSIHGIDEETVRDASEFAVVHKEIDTAIGSAFVVSHTAFDRGAIVRACANADIEVPSWTWIDSAACARRAWPDVRWGGYGLATLAERLGIAFNHHDAGEDARASGEVLVAASRATGLDCEGWLARCRMPIDPNVDSSGRIALSGAPDGPLAGNVVVFTGALQMKRADAARLAAKLGCDVAPGVTKKTTMLVCGDQDARRLNGGAVSNKYEKAQMLAKSGQEIRFLTESDFLALSALDA